MSNMALTPKQQALIINNYQLIYKFAGLHKLDITKDVVYDALIDGLCNAAKCYKPELGAFSTLAFTIMDNSIKYYYRHSHAKKRKGIKLSLDSFYSDENADEENFYNYIPDNNDLPDDLCCLKSLIKDFDKRQRYIIICLYNGMTYRQIANVLNISYPRVGQIVASIRKKLSVYYPNMV